MSEDKRDTPEEKLVLNTTADEKEADGTLPSMDGGPELDSSKVKFINGGADASVDIESGKQDNEFVGLTKEELMQYAKDPYWVRVRWVLLILFWLAWLAMLVAAIIIIVMAPRCPPRPDLQWWQKSVIYQVYPRSFQDTNGDGVGDIKGVEEHVDYLRHKLNVTAVWLSPVYQSPMADFGYDISDHKAIDPQFGTMADFDNLRSHLHRKDISVIMDFVPNHTSRNHTWFQESRKSDPDNKYRDYYVWHEGSIDGNGDRVPPNNWLSVFGGSAWEFDAERQAYYLHQFLPEQPDLNIRNPDVQAELKDILKFWLDKGVDGFRIDAVAHLFETPNITTDEPTSGNAVPEDDYDYLNHIYTTYQPETYQIVTEWKELLDQYSDKTEKYKFMAVEVYGTANQTMPFYSYNNKKGADMPFNMNLINLKSGCNATCVYSQVHEWMSAMPSDKWANWVTGNHDNSRIATRMGDEYVNAANMLLLLLPGTPVTYYGEEIGMVDGDISWEDTKDPAGKRHGESNYREHSRDPERTPMQWTGGPKAGFTEGEPWLPVNPDYGTRNVKAQLAHGGGKSNIEVYSDLTLLRQEPSFQWGKLHYGDKNENIFSFIRQAEGFPGYLVAINFGPGPAFMDFHAAHPDQVPRKGVVVATTANFADYHRAEEFGVGTDVMLDNIYLQPSEGVVFKWEAGAHLQKE